MTEDEAKTKWCPQTRVAAAGPVGGSFWNRSLDDAGVETGENTTSAHVKLSRCIGSACMAWRRWYFDPLVGQREGQDGGYCGLAGRPT